KLDTPHAVRCIQRVPMDQALGFDEACRGVFRNGLAGNTVAMLYLIECLQRFLGESAEKIVGAQLATQTAFNAGQTIRRFHGCSSFTERLGSVACPISTDLFSGRILGSHLYGH